MANRLPKQRRESNPQLTTQKFLDRQAGALTTVLRPRNQWNQHKTHKRSVICRNCFFQQGSLVQAKYLQNICLQALKRTRRHFKFSAKCGQSMELKEFSSNCTFEMLNRSPRASTINKVRKPKLYAPYSVYWWYERALRQKSDSKTFQKYYRAVALCIASWVKGTIDVFRHSITLSLYHSITLSLIVF